MQKITAEVLNRWNACPAGFRRFRELFPDGADLKTAADALANDGHVDWSIWLFDHCRKDAEFAEQAKDGFQNTGDRNTGHQNTGHQNTGDRNTGHQNTGHQNTGHRNTGHQNTGRWNTGHQNTGHQNTGHWNTGRQNTGDRNTGDWNTGHWNTGHRNTGRWNTGGWNTGHRNTGDQNTGDRNTGHQNTGHQNTGHQNTGHWNTGHRNTGDQNTGDRNTGHQNTGHQNTGHWNTGHQNTGHFNTITPGEILVFNRSCLRAIWDECQKPDFIFNVELTYWVAESEMTDAEKAADPNFYMRGGQLRKRSHKEAWRLAWESATQEDRALVERLPNFDPDVFLEITGIDVRNQEV